ncbi:MAG: hypothetical protein J0I84_20325 [Terrimonas sp.]|nr:hypothetical protein [Terrimonas sp.]
MLLRGNEECCFREKPDTGLCKSGPQHGAEHIIAQRDVEFFNSMIEDANKNLKYHFFYHKDIADFNSLCHYLPEAISDFITTI